MADGKLAGEQQRGADVLVQEGVDLRGGQLVEPAVAAAGVVDDEDAERPERVGGSHDHALRRLGLGEVRLKEGHGQLGGDRPGASRFGAPTLRGVVRRPAVDEHGRPGIEQPPRDRIAEPSATTDTRNERIAAGQVDERDPTPRPWSCLDVSRPRDRPERILKGAPTGRAGPLPDRDRAAPCA